MTLQDIDLVINAFVEAAITAKSIGFDAIELHGAHGYLLDQFFGVVQIKGMISMPDQLRNAVSLQQR